MAEAFSQWRGLTANGNAVGWTFSFTHCLKLSMEPCTSPGVSQAGLVGTPCFRGSSCQGPDPAWHKDSSVCVTSVPAYVLVLERTESGFSVFWVTWLLSQPCLAMESTRGCGSGVGSNQSHENYSRGIDYSHMETSLLLALWALLGELDCLFRGLPVLHWPLGSTEQPSPSESLTQHTRLDVTQRAITPAWHYMEKLHFKSFPNPAELVDLLVHICFGLLALFNLGAPAGCNLARAP